MQMISPCVQATKSTFSSNKNEEGLAVKLARVDETAKRKEVLKLQLFDGTEVDPDEEALMDNTKNPLESDCPLSSSALG